DVAHDLLLERDDHRTSAPVGVWIQLGQAIRDPGHVGPRLFDRDAGLEPADATQPKARLAIPEGIGQLTEWHVDIAQKAALKEIEAGRTDANDGVDTVARLDGLTERGGRAAVFPLPQALADDGERRGADLVLAGREAASEDWLDPDHREELGRDELHLD